VKIVFLVFYDTFKRMRIIQLSDIHYPSRGEKTGKFDLVANFQKVLAKLQTEEFDVLVLSGDICYKNPDQAVYAHIKSQLETLHKPIYPIAGNHDSSSLIASVFGLERELKDGLLYYIVDFETAKLVFLDTSMGKLGAEQRLFFEKSAEGDNEKPLMLFLHHPPVEADVVYMQRKYALSDLADVSAWLTGLPFSFTAFCGHYHSERSVAANNANVYLTPSLLYQVDPVADPLRIADCRPAYRSIQISPSSVQTNVVYVD